MSGPRLIRLVFGLGVVAALALAVWRPTAAGQANQRPVMVAALPHGAKNRGSTEIERLNHSLAGPCRPAQLAMSRQPDCRAAPIHAMVCAMFNHA